MRLKQVYQKKGKDGYQKKETRSRYPFRAT